MVHAAGVRAAITSLVFIAWFFVLDGITMTAIYAVTRRKDWGAGPWRDRRGGGLAGLVTLVAFGSALLAVGLAPVGEVAALRETSVLFALAFAHWGLAEAVTPHRLAGGAAIAAGAALIAI